MNKRIIELAIQSKLRIPLLLQHWGTVDALTDSEQEELENILNFAELIVKDIHASLREQWYKENDKVVDTDDKRAVAIHVGVKNGLMTACNTVFSKYIDDKKWYNDIGNEK